MVYQPPGVRIEVQENTRIVSLDASVRAPAIVGVCPGSKTVTDEAIQRGSGTSDLLANSGVATITKVAAVPGAPAGSTSIYSDSEYQLSGGNSIDWSPGPEEIEPSEGAIYYVSYTYNLVAASYLPILFTSSEDVLLAYGAEAANNSLATGCIMALENGAPVVYGVRASGSIASRPYFIEAFEKLEKVSNVYVVVPMSPLTDIHADALDHVLKMSAVSLKMERQLFLGPSGSIGDSDSAGTLVYMAGNPSNKRRTMVAATDDPLDAPIVRDGRTLDNSYVAASTAGRVCGTEKYTDPVTGVQLVGFSISNEHWNETQMNLMAAAGITVIRSKNDFVTIRHALTTDQSSADTAEISVVSATDRVVKATREYLEARFIGKGLVVDEALLGSIEAGVSSVWTALVDDAEIAEFGTTNDPSAGEIPIKVTQNSTEPRQVDIVGSVKLLYPLVWMRVQLVTYV